MNTQDIGTDICADVSFDFGAPQGAFRPTYEFKGHVIRVGVGDYHVFINSGEGIDLTHAEVNVHYSPAANGSCLSWLVGRLANTNTGEAVFYVHFYQTTVAGAGLSFPLVDVDHGSITIRRKVPAVV